MVISMIEDEAISIIEEELGIDSGYELQG